MGTLEAVKKTRDALAWNLKRRDELAKAVNRAEEAYAREIEAKVSEYRASLEKGKPGFVEGVASAKAEFARIKAEVDKLRVVVQDELINYQQNSDDTDKKPLPGLSRRDTLVPVIDDEGVFFTQCLKYAPHLLKIDMKAVEKYVKTWAVETPEDADKEQGYVVEMPEHIHSLLNAMDVKRLSLWTISEKTIVKDAPDGNPVADVGDSVVAPAVENEGVATTIKRANVDGIPF